MWPKLNLKDKGQMSKPNEYTDNFKSNLTSMFLSVKAKKNHFALGHGVVKYSFDKFGLVLTHYESLDKFRQTWIGPTNLYKSVPVEKTLDMCITKRVQRNVPNRQD